MKHMATILGLAAALLVTLPLVSACGSAGTPAQPKEEWDIRNRPQIWGMQALRYSEIARATAKQGVLPFRPWRDSYWPFYKKSIAQRYTTNHDYGSFAEQTGDAMSRPEAKDLSPAEKYDLLVGDPIFSATNESWNAYNRYAGRLDNSWHWMGSCSGWAPASIVEKAPKHHVLATGPSGRQIFFYTGDIKGLVSKTYDLNALNGSLSMIGSRCELTEAYVPRDSAGRPLDGRFADNLQHFSIVNDYSWDHGVIEVKTDRRSPATTFLVAEGRIDKLYGDIMVWVYDKRNDAAADVAARTRGQRAQRQVGITLFKSCRDVNPASLHLALIQNLSDAAAQKASFVVEVHRFNQVWNHGVIGFQADMQAPRPVSLDAATRRPFRARGTTHVVDVNTRLVYNPGWLTPIADYEHRDDVPIDWNDLEAIEKQYNILHLKYSLEFNADGMVIGGEWIESASGGSGLPDFIWKPLGTPTDNLKTDGQPSPLKYSLVKRLLDCSQAEPDTTVEIAPTGVPYSAPAVRCAL